MSSDELSLFSYEILGLVGSTGAGTHDLRRMVQRGRMLDWAGESQYYVEPKRLATLGYLEARKEPGKTRDRTVYTLTDKGLEALREWAGTPVRFTPVKSELLLRLLIADLVGEAATRESISRCARRSPTSSARLAEAEASADGAPAPAQVPAARGGFLRGLLELHRELVDDGRARAGAGADADAPGSVDVRLRSAEERLGQRVVRARHRAQLLDGLVQRSRDDVHAAQRRHLAEAPLEREVGRQQPVAGREHAVVGGRRAAALQVAERRHARLVAGDLLQRVGEPLPDAAEAQRGRTRRAGRSASRARRRPPRASAASPR